MAAVREFLAGADLFDLSMGATAANFRCAASTMQNALKDRGTTWQELIAEERQRRFHEAAEAKPGASGAYFTDACGYWDSTTFYSAFKSWYGYSFKEWRQKQAA